MLIAEQAFFADTIVCAARGNGTIVGGGGFLRHDLFPGDFALIAAFTEQRRRNALGHNTGKAAIPL